MNITFHHYGAAVLSVPIAQLRLDLQAFVRMPAELVGRAEHATVGLEEADDGLACTHSLTYRSGPCAAAIGEYVAACTLRPVADAPHTTLVEWTRAYRPAAPALAEQVRPFVGAMVGQDQAIAARLAADYDGAEGLVYRLFARGRCAQRIGIACPKQIAIARQARAGGFL